MKFLEEVAKSILNEYGSLFPNLLLLFPNKRAITFFNKYVAEQIHEPVFMPKVQTISEFFEDNSHLVLADPIILLAELYESFKHVTQTKDSFEEFYYWGEMLLSDFDDIDKYLIDARQLFTNIKDIKELNLHEDYLTEEQRETIGKYWSVFREVQSKEKKEFLSLWAKLYNVYEHFKARIRQKGIAYQGMISRDVIERMQTDLDVNRYHTFVCIGFVALNKCEEKLFALYNNAGKADFYWDTDLYYLKENDHEASLFIKRNMDAYGGERVNYDNYQKQKNVTAYGFSSAMSMVKCSAEIISEVSELHDTAIVVLDENLLVPLLYSLPENVDSFNISMGYPFYNTTFYSLFEDLFDIHLSRKGAKYSSKQIEKILLQPFLQKYFSEYVESKYDEILQSKQNYFHAHLFEDNPLFEMLLADSLLNSDLSLLLDVIIQFRNIILNTEKEDIQTEIELEFLFSLFTEISKLKEAIATAGLEIADHRLLVRLLKKVIRNAEVSFVGEPLKGLQIVGILETRLLDFKNVIMLSVNEGCLPKKNVASSYIPYNLRKGFGMPTPKEQDAMYSYYFYRLMQRSENIHLLYLEGTTENSKAEKSRYVSQMILEKIHDVEEIKHDVKIQIRKESELSVLPQDVSAELQPILSGNYSLSPTAVNTLFDCSLKFYLKYIKNIRIPDVIEEFMPEQDFGLIFHQAIEHLYVPFKGRAVEKNDVQALLDNPDELKAVLYNSIEEVYKMPKDQIEGYNEVLFEVLYSYLCSILKADKDYAPFEISGLEKKYYASIKSGNITFNLYGTIDRMDLKGDCLRVLDYKTGKADKNFPSVEDLFVGKKRNKVAFQAFYYALLVSEQNKYNYELLPGVISLREHAKDTECRFEMKDRKTSVVISPFSLIEDEFKEYLLKGLNAVFLEEGFKQTEHQERCQICDYKELCNR